MTTEPLEQQADLLDLDHVDTYATNPAAYGTSWNPVTLCLATTWQDGDPMPTICARTVHNPADDPRHLSYRYGRLAGGEPYTWTDDWSTCPDCSTVNERRLGDPEPTAILVRPCPAHQEHA